MCLRICVCLGFDLQRVAPADEEELAVLKSQYYACCAETDSHLGRLFDFLRERGEWERTIVVFTADHAEQLGDHWMLSKGGYFDQSYHLPLIIRDPRPPAAEYYGQVVTEFTEAVDVLPTLMEMVGLPVR